MPKLKRDCIDCLKQQKNPRLSIVALAEKYDLKDLLNASVIGCADNLSSGDLEKQVKIPANKDFSPQLLCKIYG